MSLNERQMRMKREAEDRMKALEELEVEAKRSKEQKNDKKLELR